MVIEISSGRAGRPLSLREAYEKLRTALREANEALRRDGFDYGENEFFALMTRPAEDVAQVKRLLGK